MKKIKRLILLVFLLIVVGIQFIPVDRSNPQTVAGQDFENLSGISASSLEVLKNACFDCHSNNVKYPWYSYVAPVSFVIQNHVDEGRAELNFSEWGSYSAKKKDHKLEEVSEALREGWMPLNGYVFLHDEARLDGVQREQVAIEIDTIRKELEQLEETN